MNYLRIALNNSQFPFKYEERQVPALIPGMDTANRATAAFTGSAGNMDWNIPQVIHMENYLPTARGYVGITTNRPVAPLELTGSMYSGDVYLNATSIFERGLGGWSSVGTLVDVPGGFEFAKGLKLVSTGAATFIPDTVTEKFYRGIGQQLNCLITLAANPGSTRLGLLYSADGLTGWAIAATSAASSDKTIALIHTTTANGYYCPYVYHASAGLSLITSLLISLDIGILTPVSEVTMSKPSSSEVYTQCLVHDTTIYEYYNGWLTSSAKNLGYAIGPTSSGTMNGFTYVLYPAKDFSAYTVNIGVNIAATTLTLPTGYTGAALRFMTSSNGYLIVADRTMLFWSTPTTGTDFSGYGSGYVQPAGLLGSITGLVPIVGGFLIFSEFNAISATYTNIPNAPFRFSPVADSGGITSLTQVSGDAASQVAVAWTSRGLQTIAIQGSAKTLSELTDVLSSDSFYQYGPDMKLGVITDYYGRSSTQPIRQIVAVNMVSARYVVISYRNRYAKWFQHALVLDTQLNRWGHLRLNHVSVVPADTRLTGSIHATVTDPRAMLAFLHPTGEIQTVDRIALNNTSGYGQYGEAQPPYYQSGITLGPLSLTRSSKLTLQEVEVSNITYPAEGKLFLQPENLGLETTSSMLEFTHSTTLGNSKKFYGRLTAESIECTFAGIANMQNLVLGVTKHGD